MNIFNYFKKAGIDTVDASFYRKIAEWVSWYEGNVRNFSFYKVYSGRGTYKRCRRKSMGMAKKLSEDIADLLLNERVTITLDDEARIILCIRSLMIIVFLLWEMNTRNGKHSPGRSHISRIWTVLKSRRKVQ